MSNIHTIWLDIDTSWEVLELLDKLRGMTCKKKAFASLAGELTAVHFSSLEDAAAFMDLFSFLIEEMICDERAKATAGRAR